MEEQIKTEQPLMSEEDFKSYLESHRVLKRFGGVNKFKSLNRAIRRGLISPFGDIYPNRPFNNRGNSCSTSRRKRGKHSRVHNELAKKIYVEYKSRKD